MKMKKALAFLCGLTLAMPTAAVSAFAAELEPAAVQVPHLFAASVSPLEANPVQEIVPDSAELPARFDLREQGAVTAVKNQSPYGTCWAHAIVASLETEQMPDHPQVDLSERYLATYVNSSEFGDGSDSLDSGAHACTALGLLTNWIGAVSESVAPYYDDYAIQGTREDAQRESELYVTGVHTFNTLREEGFWNTAEFEANQRAAKQAVCSGHGLYLGMNFSESATNYETSALYNTLENSLNKNDSSHAILIVGYDDNYSADNFLEKPPADGAWLIKNSWSPDYGDNGYYWVSYYDYTIFDILYFDVDEAEEHDHLYSYDDFGSNGQFAINMDGDECAYISNIFTANENGFVTDVMLNCGLLNDEYEITVYTGLTDPADPTSGEAHSAALGTMTHTGYQTIRLDEPVHINEGEQFAVVVKLTGEQGFHIACEFTWRSYQEDVPAAGFSHLSTSITDSNSLINEERIIRTFGAGQSFFSADGESWTDLYDSYYDDPFNLTGNICLRAITEDEGKVRFSTYSDALAPGAELSLSSVDGGDIWYSVNGGEYQRYTAPITAQGEMTVSAYVEGDENAVYTRHYAEKKAVITSLLTDSYGCKEYALLEEKSGIYVTPHADEVTLLPITTGTVKYGDTVYNSYEPISIPCGYEPFTISLTAEEEGLEPTVYTYEIRKICWSSMNAGTWMPESRMYWYCFSEDGQTGFRIDRVSGEREEFSYQIDADRNTLTYTVGKETRKGMISCTDSIIRIEWEDGSEETLDFVNSLIDDHMYYPNAELKEMSCSYFEAVTGKKVKSVSAEFAEFENIRIQITDTKGNKYEYYINSMNGIGSDQDGNVVDLNHLPEDTGVTSVKPGIWYGFSANGSFSFAYYYFDPNGKDYSLISSYDGSATNSSYELKNGQIIFPETIDSPEIRAAVTLREDVIEMTWAHGSTDYLYYLNDMTPDAFRFLTEEELSEKASDYYDRTMIGHLSCYAYAASPDTVTIMGYDDATSTSVSYTVNRYTGVGTDAEGNPVDLMHLPEYQSEQLRPGIWRNLEPNGENINGYYCFGEDGVHAAHSYVYNGEHWEFTVRVLNGRGCVMQGDIPQYFTYVTDEDGNMHVSWSRPDDNLYPDFYDWFYGDEMWTYVKEEPLDKFFVKGLFDLTEMAAKDYQVRTGRYVYASNYGFDSDFNAVIYLSDFDTGEIVDIYRICQFDYSGTNRNGEELNLPQTGITDPETLLTALAAFLMSGFGFFAVIRSGVLRRKED